ncbi:MULTISPECIES: protein-tyrosine phosphatase family protein [Mesoplasma]|uniref:Dual specificity phosphatase, catalytic domain protein n=1 Tax=Mesoplasma florum TaxID=2151 RepID=A0A2R3P7S3_MESFO|nr:MULTISPECIES: dual specificity protein phosphatase family protein [Mesoplasma]AVN64535.1 dual specificity phosphatase, catalytic domain protein [Mesoplasma florum]
MPIEKIKEKIFLGDQFSKNSINADKELKMSNIYFNILNNQQEKIIYQNKNFVMTENKMGINILDSHDPSDFSNSLFAPAIKYLNEKKKDEIIYTHCQLGVSRSASTIFIFLVINNDIDNNLKFEEAIKFYVSKIYPYMKVNYGVFSFLKENYPFREIKTLAEKSWEELEKCII